jgi:hypothetical protein
MNPNKFDTIALERASYRLNLFDLFAIHVLLVTDDEVSYGVADGSSVSQHQFSLMEVVRALTHPPGGLPWIKVTKAHRRVDPMRVATSIGWRTPADIENFVFSAASLSGFDQVWLFGAESNAINQNLAPAEVQALAHFMNAGGGVFATGDHANLGAALSGAVPRVRSMRKWYYPGAGPLGEPPSPDPLSADRFDTTRPNPPGQFPFDNQSDVVPMVITPTYWPYIFWRYPHPLLCGRQGVIDVMPDHMHEGEVLTPTGADPASGWTGTPVPGGLGTTVNVNGEMIVEYPALNGHQEAPVIVAQADVIGGHTTPSTEGHTGSSIPTNARRFACIGAYDGFRSGVGRVVVDSTWHHFFDLNIVGDPTAPAPKNQGFNATVAGQDVLARIENYFVNIATWLTPNKGYFLLGWLVAVLRAPATRELVGLRPVMDARFVLQLGDAVWADLRRYFPPCAIIDFVVTVFRDIVIERKLPHRVAPPDPWANGKRGMAVNPENWAAAALGGMVAALEPGLYGDEGLRGRAAETLMHRGMVEGLRVYAEVQAEQAREVLSDAEVWLGVLRYEKS